MKVNQIPSMVNCNHFVILVWNKIKDKVSKTNDKN